MIELPPPDASRRMALPARSAESAARQRARMSMTARCCNELLAELDRVAERERQRELVQSDGAERLASLYEAAIRVHEESEGESRSTRVS
ncbi:MAG: hypothetical protein HOV80_25760 [Polyangiaceae bacterium]|nr:hypothetical protein [Polyangiaceae bacterium]